MVGDLQRWFGEHVRAERVRLGHSQEVFADVIGVHRTFVGGVERGERNLTLQSVERLCERLDVDPVAMLTPVETDQQVLRAAHTGVPPAPGRARRRT